jgi:cytochrome c peroxidase
VVEEMKEVESKDEVSYIPKMDIPEDNVPNRDRIDLGIELFNDPLLSLDSSISCAACHHLSNGLADGLQFSLGVGDSLGLRNSPTLLNVGYQPYFFADGGVPSLELQVLAPIQDENEMHLSILEVAERLSGSEKYNKMAQKAYGRNIDPWVITRAIASFERMLTSFDSRYDKFVQGDSSALTTIEQKGMNLFFSGETNCKSCHPAPFFTTLEFENIGFERANDLGRMRITADSNDLWKFKVPTLRNIELTAPYFHDGSQASLSGVLNFFNEGAGAGIHKSDELKKLNLDKEELASMEAFLLTLTDTVSFWNGY